MDDVGTAIEKRRINQMAAAILARVICRDQADWPVQAAQGFLRMRFADENLDRFHGLLTKDYGNTLTADEAGAGSNTRG